MEWKLMRLADCCIIKPPKSEAREKLNSSDLVSFVPMSNLGTDAPTIELGDTRDFSEVSGSYTYFADGDVLLAKITPCFENGKLGIAEGLENGIGFGSSEFVVLRPQPLVDTKYLYYFLSQQSFRDAGERVMSGAVGHKRVPKEFIENTKIPLPSVQEQKRIVTMLDEAFIDIDKARKLTEQNLKNARELFESYLSQTFESRTKEWKKQKFGDVCHFVRGPFGGALKKNTFKSQGYAVYEQQHAIYDQFKDIRYFVDDEKFEQMSRFELFPGDLIISCSGTMGKIAIAPPNIKRGIINQALLKLTPRGDITAQFLKIWMESPNFQREIESRAQGAAIRNMASVKILKDIFIPVPPLEVQHDIVELHQGLKTLTSHLESNYMTKLSELSKLKESVLTKQFEAV